MEPNFTRKKQRDYSTFSKIFQKNGWPVDIWVAKLVAVFEYFARTRF